MDWKTRVGVVAVGWIGWMGVVESAGQSSVSSTSIRPFVVGQVPVIGSGGAVGGISIDAQGVVSRTDREVLGKLRQLRQSALGRISSDLSATSRMRKVSLRGLSLELEKCLKLRQPVSDELQFLAGLQRIDWVLVYPDQRDIVLAGYAEGWQVDVEGNVVGVATRHPVLQLDDWIVALRSARNAATEQGITCSLDPTPEGAQRLQRLLATRGLPINEGTRRRFEDALGPQRITITGVPPDSHFALVLVAADIMLKRLGMNLESAPVPGLPSYLAMLAAGSGPIPRNAMPRFWLAPKYEPLLKDADGLAWQLRGVGVQAMAEDGVLGSGGRPVTGRGKPNGSLSVQWAESMTARYEALSDSLPVFRELRNCMDLAVIAALLVKEDLPARSGCDLAVFLDEKRVAVATQSVPRSVESRATAIRKGGEWIVSVSGGVAVDSWSVLNEVEIHSGLAETRRQASPGEMARWWWD